MKMKETGIFSPLEIRNHTVKNRILRSATNDHLGNRDGSVSDAEIEMYDVLARNDVGMIITGHISVSPDLDYRADEVQLSIGDDGFIDGLRRIAEKIQFIEKALEVTEMASLSRTLLTQPDFVSKLKRGEEIKSRCIHCNKCFEIFATKYERCVFGPVLSKLEETFSPLPHGN